MSVTHSHHPFSNLEEHFIYWYNHDLLHTCWSFDDLFLLSLLGEQYLLKLSLWSFLFFLVLFILLFLCFLGVSVWNEIDIFDCTSCQCDRFKQQFQFFQRYFRRNLIGKCDQHLGLPEAILWRELDRDLWRHHQKIKWFWRRCITPI